MSDLTIYTVAWICAIGTELVAAKQFLDETHDDADQLPDHDDNTYILGKIGRHNVVIVALPYGQYGLVSAAIIARDMAHSFPKLRFALMVGIGGGAPSRRHDIRLGDIVVSSPSSGLGGVLQYDFGKTIQNESFQVTGHLNQPPQCLLRAISILEADYESDGNSIDRNIIRILDKKPHLRAKYGKPHPSTDRLFSSVYKHAGDKDQECTAVCVDASQLVTRPARLQAHQNGPMIHLGLIASANQLMRDAYMRDRLSFEKDVLCFEMEAAGLMNHFPCLIIRGICDYSDTHKSKEWQGYAAMAAAAYAKDLLRKVGTGRVEAEQKLVDTLFNVGTEVAKVNLTIRDQTRQQERRNRDDKDRQCLRDLFVTDPRIDKKRIEETKGGLLAGSYSWILTHENFNRFRNDPHNRLLWIRGDPGKGKTMLLCGIIDHLQKDFSAPLAYFFCQATINVLNNATSVLRGLIYHLASQNDLLIQHIQKQYDDKGEKLFAGANAWYDVRQIAIAVLNDPSVKNAIIIIDALDECSIDREQLLGFIVDCPKVRWIVSSRNWPDIEAKLNSAKHLNTLQLEVNQNAVTNAVNFFIDYKVDQLARTKPYKKDTTKEAVRRHLMGNAEGTFLWVALVCQELASPKVAERHTLSMLNSFPAGLDDLYERMTEHLFESVDAKICREILALVSIVYRPITLDELKGLVRSTEDLDQDEVQSIIELCGSFLTLREGTVYFVHQSAKEFLLGKASHRIVRSGTQRQHGKIFADSMDRLCNTLRRDIYNLRNPGYLTHKVKTPSPDPLSRIRYSCVYWADHLEDAELVTKGGINENSVINITLYFLKTKFLQWLEALSLMRNIPEGVQAMQTLARVLANVNSEELQRLAYDARRFLFSQKGGIGIAPLQTYTSALIFSPTNSLIKWLFQKEYPTWIELAPEVEADWNACLQTLEGHSSTVHSVAISPNGRRLASGSKDKTAKLWDAESGACLLTLQGHSDSINSVAISNDRVASASDDNTVRLWDAASGACLQTLQGHSDSLNSVAIWSDRVASASDDNTVKLWDTTSGTCVQTFQGHLNSVNSVAMSSDRVVSASDDNTVKLWDAESGACLQTLQGHSDSVNSVAMSSDSYRVASASDDNTVKLWDTMSGTCLQTFQGHSYWVRSVAMSTDGRRLISGSEDKTVKLWDAESGACLQTLPGHSNSVYSVAISADKDKLVSGSEDNTIKLWDAKSNASLQELNSHSLPLWSVAISADRRRLASGSEDKTIKLWDAESGTCLQTFRGHSAAVWSIAISTNGRRLVSGSDDETVKLWNSESGACLQTFKGHFYPVRSVAISTDGSRLSSGSDDNTIKLWDVASGVCLQTFQGHSAAVWSLAFSTDSYQLASGSDDHTVKLWSTESDACLQTLRGHSSRVRAVAISTDGCRIVSGSHDKTIKLWDVVSGVCVETIKVNHCIYYLSFEPDNPSHILSNTGYFTFDSPSIDSAPSSQAASASNRSYYKYGISADNVWIVQNGDNLIWLPPDYRPLNTIVSGPMVKIGSALGRVWAIRLAEMVKE
ncbi:hypothetical protein PFICI_10927 [Pestalotiopsis fici W106-1]|uniref:NACHT domain-containing protein n=1 Tax=Pestalotiopsis fici (strain W106-1 / CGMCC3.15140) TaxID=1229662 RepID=W3WT51_PESFW|nr:uncharacterized protein PFICI_10927 [Pestalotiopsis fici W106-1]ETS77053.1 hypothetical protein PFICI_10927 [Pestalotiopsis fici W106-1]